MTYCLVISIDSGLVFASDSRTNAGVDNISTYSKMHRFGADGDRQFVILSAGNLATTQAVIGRVSQDIHGFEPCNLMNVATMDAAADYLGIVSKEIQGKQTGSGVNYEASFIIGGQIRGSRPCAFLVYAAGNHITTSSDTSYLQVGEGKYGKPILDRILNPGLNLETAALCALVSMDSTIRSNLTVGPPIEVLIYDTDSFIINRHYRFAEDSEYLRELKKKWDFNLKAAFKKLPPIAWGPSWDKPADQDQM